MPFPCLFYVMFVENASYLKEFHFNGKDKASQFATISVMVFHHKGIFEMTELGRKEF